MDFEEAYRPRVIDTFAGYPPNFISNQDLVAAKKASGRAQDLIDIEALKMVQ